MPVHKEWAFVSLSRRLTLPREGCNRIDPSRWYFKDVLLKIFAALTIAGSSAFAVLHSFFLNWGSWCSSSWLSSSKHFLSLVYNFLSLCKLHNSQRFLNINFDFPSTLYIVENSALSANVQSSCALSTFPYSPSGSWSPPCCAGSRARMGAQGGLRIPSHQTVSYRGMSTNWDGCCHKIAQWYGYHPMDLGANSFVWNPIPANRTLCAFAPPIDRGWKPRAIWCWHGDLGTLSCLTPKSHSLLVFLVPVVLSARYWGSSSMKNEELCPPPRWTTDVQMVRMLSISGSGNLETLSGLESHSWVSAHC